MSEQKWKPGDVALTAKGTVALCHANGRVIDIDGGPWSNVTFPDNLRPLVVIDPEDREQAGRLLAAYSDAVGKPFRGADEPDDWRTDRMQAALREFASPTPPKPDEPQRIGAVVEDGMGHQWVRISDGWDDPYGADPEQVSPAWRRRGCTARHYAKINVVRVLSEGVTP